MQVALFLFFISGFRLALRARQSSSYLFWTPIMLSFICTSAETFIVGYFIIWYLSCILGRAVSMIVCGWQQHQKHIYSSCKQPCMLAQCNKLNKKQAVHETHEQIPCVSLTKITWSKIHRIKMICPFRRRQLFCVSVHVNNIWWENNKEYSTHII